MLRGCGITGLVAGLLAVMGAADARATCFYSTPSSTTFADSPADGEAGLAPEIIGVTATSNAACGLGVDVQLAQRTLIEGDVVGIYLNTDGNLATGSPDWDGADRVVIFVGQTGPDLPPGLGTWTGTEFSFAGGAALTASGPGGFAGDLNRLGVAEPATIGIVTAALWQGIVDDYVDFAPDVGAAPFAFPVAFSTMPPPPAPPPPPPAPPATALPAPAAVAPRSCTVPNLRRMTSARARRRLRSVRCRFRLVRVRSRVRAGRVVSTSPRAGARTRRTVVVPISRGRRRTASAASLARYAATERALSAVRAGR